MLPAMRLVERRRICWPNPDATCLHGGCGYCNDAPFRDVATIRAYAEGAGVLPHRGIGEQDALAAFFYGWEHGWFNAESKVVERPDRVTPYSSRHASPDRG